MPLLELLPAGPKAATLGLEEHDWLRGSSQIRSTEASLIQEGAEEDSVLCYL